ncbi:hypothetical protein EV644_1603 [Kribbella orskensis]|uniref:Uncharacterized protein n=1 Tax=Kribbella orskensis TaxID=2512216 RepID=A0ABY2B5J0_9ACTN|nr:hypothetical protein EV642_1653 [Kribbella sp. VKM Ac-2500]TCO07354.1 hypothetical protein EV644_1603 [Kribbella orskensis]
MAVLPRRLARQGASEQDNAGADQREDDDRVAVLPKGVPASGRSSSHRCRSPGSAPPRSPPRRRSGEDRRSAARPRVRCERPAPSRAVLGTVDLLARPGDIIRDVAEERSGRRAEVSAAARELPERIPQRNDRAAHLEHLTFTWPVSTAFASSTYQSVRSTTNSASSYRSILGRCCGTPASSIASTWNPKRRRTLAISLGSGSYRSTQAKTAGSCWSAWSVAARLIGTSRLRPSRYTPLSMSVCSVRRSAPRQYRAGTEVRR